MKLTTENKQHIDAMSYKELLRIWRFARAGDLWFAGETGGYWGKRMEELRAADPAGAAAASKEIG